MRTILLLSFFFCAQGVKAQEDPVAVLAGLRSGTHARAVLHRATEVAVSPVQSGLTVSSFVLLIRTSGGEYRSFPRMQGSRLSEAQLRAIRALRTGDRIHIEEIKAFYQGERAKTLPDIEIVVE